MATFRSAFEHGGSSFIRDQFPKRYGDQQDNYIQKVRSIVKETSNRFKQAVDAGEDLQKLFHETIASLAAKRAALATEHKTEGARDFGRRRDADSSFDVTSSTMLGKPYVKYNDPLFPLFKKYLDQVVTNKFEPPEQNTMNWPPCLGRNSSMAFSFLKREETTDFFAILSYEGYLRLCALCNISPPSKETFSFNLLTDLVMNKKAMTALKEKNPEEYNRLRIAMGIAHTIQRHPTLLLTGCSAKEIERVQTAMRFLLLSGNSLPQTLTILYGDLLEKDPEAYDKLRLFVRIALEGENKKAMNLQEIVERFPLIAQKLDWAIGTLYGDVEEEKTPLSQYLIWFDRDCKPNPVEAMEEKAIFTILHQDPLLIETMIDDMGKVFEQVLKCKSDDLNTLTNSEALLQHEFAQDMPLARGTAAISEWLEMAIYDFHGYDLSYNKDKMVNLEAITSPLATFIKKYPKTIHLEKRH